MKYLVLTMALIFSTSIFAQQQPERKGRGKERMEKLAADLGLTKEQKAKIREYRKANKPAERVENPSKEARMQRMQKFETFLGTILTEDQNVKLKAIKEKRKKRRQAKATTTDI